MEHLGDILFCNSSLVSLQFYSEFKQSTCIRMADLVVLKNKRTPIKSALTRFKNNFRDHDKSSGLGTLPVRLPAFELLYEKYNEIQTQIEMVVVDDDILSPVEERERTEFENAYYGILQEVKNFITQCRESEAP